MAFEREISGTLGTDGDRLLRKVRPLLGGAGAVLLVLLSMLAAMAVGWQEYSLLAFEESTATAAATATAPATAVPPASVVEAPPTETPAPTYTPQPTSTPEESATPLPTPIPEESPTSTPTRVCTPPANWQTYVVKQGDISWSNLAQRYQTTKIALLRGNCLTDQPLRVGMTIWVPKLSTPKVVAPKATQRPVCGPPASWFQYLVRPGDTLSSLAFRCHTTISALRTANCLPGTTIYANTWLWVPCYLPPPTRTPLPTRAPTKTSAPTADPSPTVEPSVTIEPSLTADPSATEPPPTEPPPTDPPPTDPPPTDPPPTDPPPTDPLPTDPPPTTDPGAEG